MDKIEKRKNRKHCKTRREKWEGDKSDQKWTRENA